MYEKNILYEQLYKQMETFFDEKYIAREPVRYLFDIHSIGFVFKFSKQRSVIPILKYNLENKSYRKRMNIVNTDVDGLHKIVYGPLFFNDLKGTVNPSNVKLFIVLNNNSKKVIFRKKIKLLDYNIFNSKYYYFPLSNSIDLTFAVCSCFNLYNDKNKDLLIPTHSDLRTLKLFNDTCKQKNPLMIISSGDIVYLGNACNNLSSYGIQNAYDNLINLKESKSLWSNYTWVCVNDDHDLSYNNGIKDTSNIGLLRKKLDENFPIGEQVMDPNKFRATYFSLKNVYFITLDTVTESTLNPDYKEGGNKYLAILGDEQINYLKNALSCIVDFSGHKSLIFIVVGKSMFGSTGAFPDHCVKEKNQIFDFIKKLRLKNIVFICGDSHFSDFTEFKVEDEDGSMITIREIRNSSITSVPSNPTESDNPDQYPGSLSKGVNNFGFVNIKGLLKEYKITYTNYTLNGEQFKHTWKLHH